MNSQIRVFSARTKCRKLFRRYRLWLGNIWIARIAFRQSPTDALRRAWNLLCFLLRHEKAETKVWQRRLRHGCGKCQHFNRARRTCGTAGKFWMNPVTGEWEQAGCLCSAELKVLDPHATCWLAEATEDEYDGWQ